MKTICVFATLLALFSQVYGFKVLGVLPFGSNSHFAIGHSIVKSLAEAGHEVTVISPYPLNTPVKNYRDISTADLLEEYQRAHKFDAFSIANTGPVMSMAILYMMGADLVNRYLSNERIQKFLASDEKFDVCIIEIFNADAMLGIADRFDCILISYTTFGAVKWINDMTANDQSPSYVPHPFLHYSENMTFTERLRNTFTSRVEDILYSLIHLPYQRRLYQKYFPNARKPFDELYKNSAIIFMNNHVSSSSARPYLPNMIEISGIHVEPAKPLPTDIQEFLDSSPEGVILFSMGSMIQSVNWPLEKREALVKAFGKMKEKVLWKYENDTLPNKPKNVMIGKWLPQRDILAHPNVKLFITHGGLLGATEALVEGVPILGIPIYGDQKMNTAKAVARGYGLQIDYETMCEESILTSLNELLTNPKYKEKAKEIQARFNDRPMAPKDLVVYWTEYAVRHKGALHLRAAGNNLSYIEFHLIDVYAVFIAVILLTIFLIYQICKFGCSRIFKKTSDFDDKEKTN